MFCPSCRLLKPRPQFSSCAAFACTCPRTSWPAGVWETSRIISAHTCLIKASAPPSHIGKSPSPPSCLSLQKQIDVLISTRFLLKDLNLCLDLSFFVTYSFSPPWPEADSVPILVFSSRSQCSSSFLCHFWIGSPIFFILLPLHSLLLTHPFCLFEPARTLILSGWLFSWSRTVNSTGHWRNSLCCIKTGTNNTQVFTVVLRWTCFYILVVIRKDC